MRIASRIKAFLSRGFQRGRTGGFTLVEVLVVVALTGVVTAAVYKALSAQQKIYSVQDQAAEMQENMRSAMDVMVRDVRMAGCDPLGKAGAGFLTATATAMRFTMDIPKDADGTNDTNSNGIFDEIQDRSNGNTAGTDEDVTYTLLVDGTEKCLTRTTGGAPPASCAGNEAIARNIEDVDFFYTLAAGPPSSAPADRTQIRRVEITILTKNANPDKDFTNKTPVYTFPSGRTFTPSANDHYRRRMQRTVVLCRNMGFAK